MTDRYDVVVVGARCAGAATALHLARAGHRTLLVDRDTFPSDTLSTHFLQLRAMSYLNRWGLVERVAAATPTFPVFTMTREGITLRAAPSLPALRARLHPLAGEGCAYACYAAPRRHFLDAVLVDAARAAGADLFEGFHVDAPVVDEGGAVVGVRGHRRDGLERVLRARLVILADGRTSRLARQLEVPVYRAVPTSTFSYYGYWRGLDLDGIPPLIHLRGRLTTALLPTNDGEVQVMVIGPGEWAGAFKADLERSFVDLCELVVPGLAERLAAAERTERLRGIVRHPVFLRRPFGPGYGLVGDAGLSVDQVTAMGITFAFRDSELAAAAADLYLTGARSLDDAFGRYQATRDEDSIPYYDFTASVSELAPPTPADIAALVAMEHDEDATRAFFSAFQDLVPLSTLGAAPDPASFADHPALQALAEAGEAYARVPFAGATAASRAESA